MKKAWKARGKFFHAKHPHCPPVGFDWSWGSAYHSSHFLCLLSEFLRVGVMRTSDLLRMNLTTEAIAEQHYSQILGFPFNQLPSPVNSESRMPSFCSEWKPVFSQRSRSLLTHVSELHSHLCSLPSSHTSLLTLLWIYHFCSLLEGFAPKYLPGSLLFFQFCAQIWPSPKSHWNSPLSTPITI